MRKEWRVKKDSIVFLTNNIKIGSNTIWSDSDTNSAESAKSAFKIALKMCLKCV